MAEFRTTRLVEFSDTDMAGIVHFASFFRYMESAEHEFLRARGLSVAMEWEGESIGFPRVSASCDFLRPVRFEDVVEITVSVANLGRKSVTYSFEMAHGGKAVARGQLSAVCCRIDAAEHRIESIEIPAGIRERLSEETGRG